MAKRTHGKKDATKKKKSYLVFASPEFSEKQIGETKSDEDSKVIGRKINLLLSDLTGDHKAQNVKISFRVKAITGTRASTEVSEYTLIPALIKRIVRVGKSKIDDSFTCTTQDGVKVQLKPIILTRFKTQHSIHTALRKKVRDMCADILSKMSYGKFITDVSSKTLQKELINTLKRIYPVSSFDFRMIQKLN